MTNYVDKETAEIMAGLSAPYTARDGKPRTMVLKRKTAYPTPALLVNPDGFWKRKGTVYHADVSAITSVASQAGQASGSSLGGNLAKGAATGAALGSIVPGIGTAIGGAAGAVVGVLSSVFKKKPVGDKGWQSFIMSAARPVGTQYYPTLQQILDANFVKDAKQLAALKSTYSQNTGMGTEGDWHFAVTNANPITIDWFKGDSEHFTSKAGVGVVTADIQKALADQAQSQILTPNVANPTAPAVSMVGQQTGNTGIAGGILSTLKDLAPGLQSQMGTPVQGTLPPGSATPSNMTATMASLGGNLPIGYILGAVGLVIMLMIITGKKSMA